MSNYSVLENVVTPIINVTINGNKFAFDGGLEFMDADDELKEFASHLRNNASHLIDVDPDRIKYFYSTRPYKDGGKYVLGTLQVRSDEERLINEDYDFIAIVNYKLWKDLDISNKVIQFDKILCKIKIDANENLKIRSVDSKEYITNMYEYGPTVVLDSSLIVSRAMENIIDEEKTEIKASKPQKQGKGF